jgi:membrane protease YdiL (CAAX protease family)
MSLSITAPQKSRSPHELSRRQWLVLLAPIALIATTYPVFRASETAFGDAVGGQLAWFVGMSFYWTLWGLLFTVWLLGRRTALALTRPQPPTPTTVAHVVFIVVMAGAVRFLVPGMAYEKATTGAAVLLAISPFANGLFEELLWRGAFFVSFPHNTWLGVVWPSVWFGLWHLVPGSLSADGPHLAMVVGPTLMGIYLAHVTRKTGTIWWAILAHSIGGLVMIS